MRNLKFRIPMETHIVRTEFPALFPLNQFAISIVAFTLTLNTKTLICLIQCSLTLTAVIISMQRHP